MSRNLFLLCSILALHFASIVVEAGRVKRIINGIPITIDSAPFQVSVLKYGTHACGGSIVTAQYILTAAQCTNLVKASELGIQHSVTVIGDKRNIIGVQRVIVHPEYDSLTSNNNIALLVLKSPIPFSDQAKPIRLATVAPDSGTQAFVTGWGRLSEDGTLSSRLQLAQVSIVSPAICKAQYPSATLPEDVLCAGDYGGKGFCDGDSGGPLVANGKQVGIVSWSFGCGRENYSGIYTNVAALHSWIEENIDGSGGGPDTTETSDYQL